MENRFWKIQANLLAFVAGVGAMGIQMHVAERHRLWPLIGAGSVREKVLLTNGGPRGDKATEGHDPRPEEWPPRRTRTPAGDAAVALTSHPADVDPLRSVRTRS